MSPFLPGQIEDLRDLQRACRTSAIEIVIIGAMAYRTFIRDVERETYDIDLAVAVDLEELPAFYQLLAGLGWTRVARHEQRWRATRGTLMDLLPAGTALRERGRIDWPQSGLSMSLAGFEQAFRNGVPVRIGPQLECRVAPPPVLAVMKIASFLDDPHGRAKDVLDFRRLLKNYQHDSDRLFSDEVFQAELADIGLGGAFLLGRDVAAIATGSDLELIGRFLSFVSIRIENAPAIDLDGRDTSIFREELDAFRRGVGGEL